MTRGGARTGAGRPKGMGKFGVPTKPIRVPIDRVDDVLNFIHKKNFSLPLYTSHISAGVPSAADSHSDNTVDLNEYLVQHPSATFLVKVTGDSMINAGINTDDILVVDRSIEATHGRIVIAAVDGHLTVKRLHKLANSTMLVAENPEYAPLTITEDQNVTIWGVVTNVIHKVL